MPKHWSERYSCGLCGKSFRSYIAEARHRHNAPLLCRRTKKTAKAIDKALELTSSPKSV